MQKGKWETTGFSSDKEFNMENIWKSSCDPSTHTKESKNLFKRIYEYPSEIKLSITGPTKPYATACHRVYIVCSKEHAKYFSFLTDISDKKNEKERRFMRYLNLASKDDKSDFEKIFSVIDKIHLFPEKWNDEIAKTFDLRKHALDYRFEHIKEDLKMRRIITFLLSMKKNKVKAPKVVQFEILCFLTDRRLSQNQLKDYCLHASKELSKELKKKKK